MWSSYQQPPPIAKLEQPSGTFLQWLFESATLPETNGFSPLKIGDVTQ